MYVVIHKHWSEEIVLLSLNRNYHLSGRQWSCWVIVFAWLWIIIYICKSVLCCFSCTDSLLSMESFGDFIGRKTFLFLVCHIPGLWVVFSEKHKLIIFTRCRAIASVLRDVFGSRKQCSGWAQCRGKQCKVCHCYNELCLLSLNLWCWKYCSNEANSAT